MNSDRHTLVWWERFWKSAQYNFGSPRAELIQEFKTYRDRNKDKELKAIDIGSGNGRYALELAKIGYETFALELTKSGLKTLLGLCVACSISLSGAEPACTFLSFRTSFTRIVPSRP